MTTYNNHNDGSKHMEKSINRIGLLIWKSPQNKINPTCLDSFLQIATQDGLTVLIVLLKTEYAC